MARKKPARTDSSRADPVTDYASSVVTGRIVAGPQVRATCARHLRDMETAHLRGFAWSLDHVDRVLQFFAEVLRLNGGKHEGRPFVPEPWQAFILGSLFGWVDADGMRRFRTAYMEVGKGNGKSPLAAGIGIYCLTADGEQRAEVYAAATKKDQAMILFRDAVAMVDLAPALSSRILKSGTGERCWNLAFPETGSWFRAIASEDGQSGPRPHCSLIDEIHEHQNATMVDMLSLGQKGRTQPLTIEITNSGFDRTTVCYQHNEYTARVVAALPGDRDFNDKWFGYVCSLDEQDDPLADTPEGRACWIKANPNLGVSIDAEDYLAKEVREAQGMPAKQSKVRRLNFCQWVDAENPWIEGHLWMRCEARGLPDPIGWLAECDEVVGSLDLSGTRDLTALGLAGVKDGQTRARVEFWTPGDTMAERAAKDRVDYGGWARRGYLNAPPGSNIDYGSVAERIAQLQILIPTLRRIAFDPYRIHYLEPELEQLGIEIALIPHPQGYYKAAAKKDDEGNDLPQLWMPRSVELLEKGVTDGTLAVDFSPVLQWNSASAVLEADPKNNRIFTKRKSRGRIDGIVALAMALGLLLDGPGDQKPKEYQMLFVGA